MFTVSIFINGNPIITRSAVNITDPWTGNETIHTYEVDTGEIVKHKRAEGAVKLAIKLLKGVKEPRGIHRVVDKDKKLC